VVAESTLRRLSSFLVLLVCTGNTCRSPMAEAIARSLIAEKLQCTPEQLEDRGVLVMSAGIAAMPGSRPSPEAVEVMHKAGLSLDAHESQPLTESLARQADLIFTMTRSHRQAIVSQWPDTDDRLHLLCLGGGDVSDPIGGPLEVYERCAAQIREELEQRVNELDIL
jgi:protein-tyrosine phosphatase